MKSLEGHWQFDLLNGAPEPESSKFILSEGSLTSPETGEFLGQYDVIPEELALTIAMAPIAGVQSWAVKARFPFTGALSGEYMLGEAGAIFDDGVYIAISKCAFHRLPI